MRIGTKELYNRYSSTVLTAQVRATDSDKGLNAQLVYSLHTAAAAGSEVLQLFGVHLASGTLFLQQPALSLGT